MEAIGVLLMRILVCDKTASGLQGRSYCTMHDLLASSVGKPTSHGELQVSQTLSIVVDAYGLVVPHQSHLLLWNLILLALFMLLLQPLLILLHRPLYHHIISSLPWVEALRLC